MKGNSILILASALFSLVSCSLKESIGSDWFIKDFVGKTYTERNSEYDFKTSMAFISKHEGTAAFSPLCSDLNVLLQCSYRDFGKDYIEFGKSYLTALQNSLKDKNKEIFSTFNSLHVQSLEKEETETFNGYFYKHFCKENLDEVYKEHSEMVKKETKELLETPLKKADFKNNSRIYTSIVYFKDSWFKKFDKKESGKRNFTLHNGKKLKECLCIQKISLNMIIATHTALNLISLLYPTMKLETI